MRVAANAEAYALARLNIFFTAHNQTPADGNLTGQCVTLNKWFMLEMTDVPSPFAARGDARYVGQNLVAQGHAVKVAYADRRRGDFAVFEYGLYGHIGVMLDSDRIFEQNVNVPGVASKIVDGSRVYASRIGRLSESWRPVQATIYRIKTYSEGGGNAVMDEEGAKELWRAILHREPENDNVWRGWVGKSYAEAARSFRGSPEWLTQNHAIVFFGDREKQLRDANAALNAANKALQDALANDATDKAAIEAALKQAQEAQAHFDSLTEEFNKIKTELDEAEKQQQADQETGNAFLRWLGQQLNKLLGKG